MCVGLCDGRMYAWRILSHAESREQLDAPRNCSIRSYNSRCENKLHVWQHLHNQTCRDSGKNYNMTSSELLHRSQIKPGLGRGRLTAVFFGGGVKRYVYTAGKKILCIMSLSWDLNIWLEALTTKHHWLHFILKC